MLQRKVKNKMNIKMNIWIPWVINQVNLISEINSTCYGGNKTEHGWNPGFVGDNGKVPSVI